MLGLIVPWWTRWAVLAVALVAAAAFGAARMHAHDQARYDALEAQFEEFKDKTAALGREAKAAAVAKEAADKKRKEDADAENSVALATLADTIGKLRARSSGRRVPDLTACSANPAGADRERAEFQPAYRDLLSAVRAEADRCSERTVKLNTARRWAVGQPDNSQRGSQSFGLSKRPGISG